MIAGPGRSAPGHQLSLHNRTAAVLCAQAESLAGPGSVVDGLMDV